MPEAEAEGCARELVGEQDLRLADAAIRIGSGMPSATASKSCSRSSSSPWAAFCAVMSLVNRTRPPPASRILADPHPAAVGDAELLVLGRARRWREPVRDEVGAHVGVVHAAGRGRAAHHVLEARAQPEHAPERRRRMVGVAVVVVDQPTLRVVVDREPVDQALGGGQEALVAGPGLALGGFGRILGRLQLGGALGDAALEGPVGPLQRRLGPALRGHVADAADQAPMARCSPVSDSQQSPSWALRMRYSIR